MGNVLRIGIGIVALRLVTSSIVEAELGAYWILTTVAALLSSFADLGLGIGAVRHLPIASSRDKARRLMQTVLLLRLAFLLLLCGAVFFCKPWVLRLFDAQAIGEKYYYVYIFVVFTSLGELYSNFLQGLNRFRAIALFAIVSSFARLGLIALLVLHWRMGLDGLFLAEALSLLLGMGLSAQQCSHGLRLRPARAEAVAQLRFGWPLHLNTLLAYTANRINTVLIGSVSPVVAGGIGRTEAVSYFMVASRIPDQLSVILRTYTMVYLPNMTRFVIGEEKRRAQHLLASSLRLMSYSFAMLTLLLTFFRHEIMAVLAPPSYQLAAPAIPLILGGLTFASLGMVMGNTIVALGDSSTPVKINFWTSLFSFGLNVYCIRRWGFMGAAWANLGFNAVAYGVTDLVLARRLRPESRSYLGILAFLAVLLAAGFDSWAGMAARSWLAVRLVLLATGALGSLALSRGLRDDIARVWKAGLGRGRGAPLGAGG